MHEEWTHHRGAETKLVEEIVPAEDVVERKALLKTLEVIPEAEVPVIEKEEVAKS